jgi:hypothetical protein
MMALMGEKEAPPDVDRRPSQSVVVDIGAGIGVLVVNTDQALDEAEIEICPSGSEIRTHTVVRARHLPRGGVVYAGVFPSLPEGDYTLLAEGTRPPTRFRITGGEVTQIDW